MKTKILILSSLICAGTVYTAAPGVAKSLSFEESRSGPMYTSDLGYDDFNFNTATTEPVMPAQKKAKNNAFDNRAQTASPKIGAVAMEYGTFDTAAGAQALYANEQDVALPVHAVELKPVLPDSRKPLWIGDNETKKIPAFQKTVDSADGVPLWDDSISDYKDKDFSDWFMQPRQEQYYIEGADLLTRNAVAEILAPYKPRGNLWGGDSIDDNNESVSLKSYAFEKTPTTEKCADVDGCPFETDAECEIWRKKPMVRENVSPRSPKIRETHMTEIIALVKSEKNTETTNPVVAPLIERYQILMKSANACCTDGMAYELKRAGASDDLIYKFFVDDANFYQIGGRCLMLSDKDLDKKYKNTTTAAVVGDVRNGCLCRSRTWFKSMLAPFAEVYSAAPEFAESKFNYTYTDGLGRETVVSINHDVKNVFNQLSNCP